MREPPPRFGDVLGRRRARPARWGWSGSAGRRSELLGQRRVLPAHGHQLDPCRFQQVTGLGELLGRFGQLVSQLGDLGLRGGEFLTHRLHPVQDLEDLPRQRG
jgi:hypothetical protein